MHQVDPCLLVRGGGRVLLVTDPHQAAHQAPRMEAFSFDVALDSSRGPGYKKHASQQTVFKLLGKDVAKDVVDGVSVTLLAYGQTSSGKSYTMFGSQVKELS